jgi:Uma2 family endonuclease
MDVATSTQVSVADYLSQIYHPDRDYLEGVLMERNVGEIAHGDAQGSVYFFVRAKCPQFWAGPEIRVQVRPERFRIPDVVIVRGGKPSGRVVTSPPEVAVEVLSPDDRAVDIQAKIDDFLDFGAACVWVINPETRRAFVHTTAGSREVKDGVLRNPAGDLAIPLAAIFD